MDTKIGIVIPVKNCLVYTQETIENIKSTYPYVIIVIDDYSDDGTKEWLATQDFEKIIDPPGSVGLAYNWNLGINRALELECTHILIMNNDVILHPTTIDSMVERLNRKDVLVVSAINTRDSHGLTAKDIFDMELPGDTESADELDFSCWMITPETVEVVGLADPGFTGAYFEDNDYHARVILSGAKTARYDKAVIYHHGSTTINQNPHVGRAINSHYMHNQWRFTRKWGHPAVNMSAEMKEKYYKTPFNRGGSLKEINLPDMS